MPNQSPYCYSNNSPVNYKDPSGLAPDFGRMNERMRSVDEMSYEEQSELGMEDFWRRTGRYCTPDDNYYDGYMGRQLPLDASGNPYPDFFGMQVQELRFNHIMKEYSLEVEELLIVINLKKDCFLF